jgi:hypothetical protein
MTKLYDIPSLPLSFLKQKVLSTPDQYADPNTVENFMMEAIRDRGCEKPIFEEELPRERNNMMNNSILTLMEHGSRYKRDPYHPELFMGDLTKDPRQSDTAPIMADMTAQNKWRYDRYIHGKLQDVSSDQIEGMVGTKRMLRQIKDGFGDTATRMTGLFDESFNTMITAANPRPAGQIKADDAIQEDQAVYQIQDERILPKYSTDIVSKLGNMVGLQWQVQPDNRYGLSSVSNVYRSNGEVNQSAQAVYRLGQQDSKFGKEKEKFRDGAMMIPQSDMLKLAKHIAHEVNVSLNDDSTAVGNERMAGLPGNKSKVGSTIVTQSKKEHMKEGNRTNKRTSKNERNGLVEKFKTHDVEDTKRGTTVPLLDRLAIVHTIERTHKTPYHTEDTTSGKSHSTRLLKNAFTHRQEALGSQKKSEHTTDRHGKQKKKDKYVEHMRNTKGTNKKYGKYIERMESNATGSNTLALPMPMENIMVDLDPTMNNDYQTRRGVWAKTADLSRQQVEDSVINPLNDTVAPFMTNYKK